MYLSYFNLKKKPFQISTDPTFLWLGEKHKEALATLKYGVMDNKGFLLLTGDVGTGKTTLINALVNNLGDDIIVATVPDPSMERTDFFNYVANAFNIGEAFSSKSQFIIRFTKFLHKSYVDQKKVLLIIDESQHLGHELLEEIRLLSNIEKQSTKLLNIFFVGQNEFNAILLKPENRAVRQRITMNYRLSPLSEKETGEFIRYRLKIAGSPKNIFTKQAFQEIYKFSEGFPRLINIICDLALLSAFVEGSKIIHSKIIKECGEELRIPDEEPSEKREEVRPVPKEDRREEVTDHRSIEVSDIEPPGEKKAKGNKTIRKPRKTVWKVAEPPVEYETKKNKTGRMPRKFFWTVVLLLALGIVLFLNRYGTSLTDIGEYLLNVTGITQKSSDEKKKLTSREDDRSALPNNQDEKILPLEDLTSDNRIEKNRLQNKSTLTEAEGETHREKFTEDEEDSRIPEEKWNRRIDIELKNKESG